jgi:3-isopropylmalate/(R)-2-methylmalate dehydratase small subunit
MTIDVRTKTLSAPGAGVEVSFPLDDSVQHNLLEGLDDIGLTLQHEPDITAFEQTRPAWMPTTA